MINRSIHAAAAAGALKAPQTILAQHQTIEYCFTLPGRIENNNVKFCSQQMFAPFLFKKLKGSC